MPINTTTGFIKQQKPSAIINGDRHKTAEKTGLH